MSSNIERIAFAITTGSNASGTATSPYPVQGRILEWVCPTASGTALFGPGATATFTVTRDGDGGTVLAQTAISAPFSRPARQLVTSTTGATAIGYDLTTGVPSADYLTAVVTQGGTSTSGTVYMLYERWIA